MLLIPAIDIREGRAVRLAQGDFRRETVYGDDPVGAARAWVEAGARRLHVVDLDGARRGEPVSTDLLRRIAHELHVPVQYGGGLRTLQAAVDALEAGAETVVLGTAALRDERFLDAALAELGTRVAIGLDARGGEVSVAGWTRGTGERVEQVARRLGARGVRRVVYTDAGRDGMLQGPDLDGLRAVGEELGGGAELVSSGGVGSLDDLCSLASAELPGLAGVISGKALYEGRFTVSEGQAALDQAAAARQAG